MNGRFMVLSGRWGRSIMAGLLVVVLMGFALNGSVYATPLSAGPGLGQARVGVMEKAAAAATYKWIDIDLSSQTLRAYSGNAVIFYTRISSGVSRHPTVQGTFRVYSKLRATRMRGGTRGVDYYDLPNVPNVMYFYGGYAIHGAYWHNNFGHPMSHGCVNLPLGVAASLYNWTPMGTTVRVHW